MWFRELCLSIGELLGETRHLVFIYSLRLSHIVVLHTYQGPHLQRILGYCFYVVMAINLCSLGAETKTLVLSNTHSMKRNNRPYMIQMDN